MGVVLSYKTRKIKTGKVMANYDIVDPISKGKIGIVEFEPMFQFQECEIIDRAITFYLVQISTFNGRRNLMCKAYSIVKHNWLPFNKQAIMLE